MRETIATHKRPTRTLKRPPNRADVRKYHPDTITLRVRDSATVVHVSTDALTDGPFHEYLDSLLTLMQLSNAEVSRRTGIGESALSKWRSGQVKPSIRNLRPLADGLGIPRATLFVRAGLLEPEDVGVDELYLSLADAISRLTGHRRETFVAHVRLLINGAKAEGDEVAHQPDEKTG